MPYYSEIRRGKKSGTPRRGVPTCVGLGRGLSKPRFAGLGDNLPLLRLKRRMNCFPSIQHPSTALPAEVVFGVWKRCWRWFCNGSGQIVSRCRRPSRAVRLYSTRCARFCWAHLIFLTLVQNCLRVGKGLEWRKTAPQERRPANQRLDGGLEKDLALCLRRLP